MKRLSQIIGVLKSQVFYFLECVPQRRILEQPVEVLVGTVVVEHLLADGFSRSACQLPQ